MLKLPENTTELRKAIKVAIEFYQGSPAVNENKLNEALAKSLNFDNYDQLSPLLEDYKCSNIITYSISFDCKGEQSLLINGNRISSNLVHSEVVTHTVVDREDRIQDLISFISEAQSDSSRAGDRALMQEDLEYLINSDDDYVLEAYATNGFISASSEPELFNRTCDEMILAAIDYYDNGISQLGTLITNAVTYYQNEPVNELYEGQLVVFNEDYLSDDTLSFTLPVEKYDGTLKDGFIIAYRGDEQYIPIEIEN